MAERESERKEAESRENFRTAVGLLDELGVVFWLDQGSLLGCVRDGCLIPWDHDIDFGVWKEQVDRESLVTRFKAIGFEQENIPREMDCVHLTRRSGKKVDITFYEKEGPMASAGWLAPKGGLSRKALNKVVTCLENTTQHEPHDPRRSVFRRLVIGSLSRTIRLLPEWLQKRLLLLLKPLNLKYPNVEMYKCRVPAAIFTSLKEIQFLGKTLNVPVESEKYLSLIYGDGWRTPKKDWVWWQESGGLEVAERSNGAER